MKIPSFVRLSKPKSFVYHPRYYKERLGEGVLSDETQMRNTKRRLHTGFLRAYPRHRRQGSFQRIWFRALSVLLFTGMVLGYLWYGAWVVMVFGVIYGLCAYAYARQQS